MLANGAKETTTTTGTGAVALSAVTGFPRFADVLSVGQYVDYAIQDGNNWEWGVGKVAAGNTLERTLVTAKFDGGTYSKNPASPLSLSGSATVFCATHSDTDGIASSMGEKAVPNALHIQTSAFGANASWSEANKLLLTPWMWPRGVDRVVSGIKLRVNTTGTATRAQVAMVDYGDDGYSFRLLGCTEDFNLTTTGVKTAYFPAPFVAPKARYGMALITDGAVTLNRAEGFASDSVGLDSGTLWDRRLVSAATFSVSWTTEITEAMLNSASFTRRDSSFRPLLHVVQP